MKNDDDLVFLNSLDNSGDDFFQPRGDLEYEDDLFTIEGDPYGFEADLETTIEVTKDSTPYWQRMFG